MQRIKKYDVTPKIKSEWLLILACSTLTVVFRVLTDKLLKSVASGMNPAGFVVITSAIVLLGVLLIRKLVYWLAGGTKIGLRFTPLFLYKMAAISWLLAAMLSLLFWQPTTVDIHLGYTYYVIDFFLPALVFFSYFLLFTLSAYVIKTWSEFSVDWLLYIHFWVTFLCTQLIPWPSAQFETDELPTAGMPRRYYDTANIEAFAFDQSANRFVIAVLALLFVTHVLLTVAVALSVWAQLKGKPTGRVKKTSTPA